MPRDGNGVYSLPANTAAVTGETIASAKFNALTQDVEADLNAARPIASGGTGATSASAARTNFGITGNLYNVTASAFILTLLDDADAAAARSTLGAGTGNGNMVGSNNLSDLTNAGTARTNLGLGSLATLSSINNGNWSGTDLAVTNGGTGASDASTARTNLGALAAADYTAADVLTKLLTVDGAGSGLDADTLDGVQGSGYALLGAASVQTFDNPIAIGNTGGGSTLTVSRASQAANFTVTLSSGNCNLNNVSTNMNLQVGGVTQIALTSSRVTLTPPLVARVAASSETSGTLTSASANRTIQATGNITINNSVFDAGDIILIYAGASSRTLTQGSGVTMRLGGTSTTGSRTLAARGVAMLFFVSASEVVVSGGAVT